MCRLVWAAKRQSARSRWRVWCRALRSCAKGRTSKDSGTAYRALLAELRVRHGVGCELHLLPAVPAPVAIACGYDLLPKVDPNIIVYDNIKPHGFLERLKVSNHERI